jgi:FAD/FMN-containing dehydrogenase
LLALNGLTHLQYREHDATIEVGPGNAWVDVYDALDPYGRYAIGGRLKTIGVPGLTLIGGVHYFINKYGFAMDNVVSYDVVLANGTQVKANDTTNPELFWALKGGANNFGIVVQFTIRTYHIPRISTTIQAFNESEVLSFIQATCDLVEHDGPEIAAGSVITISYNATTKVVGASLLGVQEGTESPPSSFDQFSRIPAVTQQYNVTTPKAWHSALDTPFQMFRVAFAHHTIKPVAHRLFEIYQDWKKAVDEIADVEGLYPTFVMNLAPKSAAAVAKNNGIGNVWGLEDDQSYICKCQRLILLAIG